MEASEQPPKAVLPPELASVADAAGRRLRAEVDGDKQAAEAGAQSLLRAATSAMNAGYSLTQITQAETQGKLDVRASLRPDTLKQVKRTGRIVRDAEAEHHRTIVRAVRLGLSTRQIAAAAGVTPRNSARDHESPDWSESDRVAEPPGVASGRPRPSERSPPSFGRESTTTAEATVWTLGLHKPTVVESGTRPKRR